MKKSFETQYSFYKQPDYPQKILKKENTTTHLSRYNAINYSSRKAFVHSTFKRKFKKNSVTKKFLRKENKKCFF